MFWDWSKSSRLSDHRKMCQAATGRDQIDTRHFFISLLFRPFVTFLHHFYRESIDIVLENEQHSMSRDPGLINVLSLKQINSVVWPSQDVPGSHGPGSNRHSSLFYFFSFLSFATFLHHFYRESIDIVVENEQHSMSRDPGLINVLRLKQINSVVWPSQDVSGSHGPRSNRHSSLFCILFFSDLSQHSCTTSTENQ